MQLWYKDTLTFFIIYAMGKKKKEINHIMYFWIKKFRQTVKKVMKT